MEGQMLLPKSVQDRIIDPTKSGQEKLTALMEFLFSPDEDHPATQVALTAITEKMMRVLDKVEKFVDQQMKAKKK
jgi:hypothetical protein